MSFIHEGIIATNGSTKITCTGPSMLITTIIINNPNTDYQIIVTKSSNIQTLIYRFDLNAGDTLRDTDEYTLVTGESLRLISDVPDTSYYVSTTQE